MKILHIKKHKNGKTAPKICLPSTNPTPAPKPPPAPIHPHNYHQKKTKQLQQIHVFSIYIYTVFCGNPFSDLCGGSPWGNCGTGGTRVSFRSVPISSKTKTHTKQQQTIPDSVLILNYIHT